MKAEWYKSVNHDTREAFWQIELPIGEPNSLDFQFCGWVECEAKYDCIKFVGYPYGFGERWVCGYAKTVETGKRIVARKMRAIYKILKAKT